MATLSAYLFQSLDGYFKDVNEGIDWHRHGQEESEWSAENLQSNNILLFGRKTFEMMAAFWPSATAYELYPNVARGMNAAEKIVVSSSLQQTAWQPTRIISGNLDVEISKLKKESTQHITILGSGSVVNQLTEARLIDSYEIMIDPVAIGAGTPLFQNLKQPLELQLTKTRSFKSGCVCLYYQTIR